MKLRDFISTYRPDAAPGEGVARRRSHGFKTFGEYLSAVAIAKTQGTVDKRLRAAPDRIVRAPAGANVTNPTSGGFLVPPRWSEELLLSAYADSVIAKLCRQVPYDPEMGTLAGGVKLPGIDETSRADGSRYGGVRAYWAAEADQVSGSAPKWKAIEFDDKKLIGVCWVTNELVADASLLDFYVRRAFAAEMSFKVDTSVFRGTGAGTPLGLLNSTARITVAKETGQAAATISYSNVIGMYKRLPLASRPRAVWLVHEDADDSLSDLNIVAPGTYVGAGAGGFPFARVKGCPVIPIEQASAIGTEGDIVLADLDHYLLLDAGIEGALSAEFAFDSDQSVFRFIQHVDGTPEFTTPITPYAGGLTRSPIVTLAARA